MEKEKVAKIELEFAEARKEIMSLRLENRKLESAITLLSKPMVMSSDSEGEADNNNKSESKKRKVGAAIVVALPQGEAQERIDSLLAENAKLAAEIVELRQLVAESAATETSPPQPGSGSRTLKAQPSTSGQASSGVATIFEKNKELQEKLKAAELKIADMEASHSANVRSINTKNEKELRKLRYDKNELEAKISDLERTLFSEKENRETESRDQRLEIDKLSQSYRLIQTEFDHLARIATKIVRNARDFSGGSIDAQSESALKQFNII